MGEEQNHQAMRGAGLQAVWLQCRQTTQASFVWASGGSFDGKMLKLKQTIIPAVASHFEASCVLKQPPIRSTSGSILDVNRVELYCSFYGANLALPFHVIHEEIAILIHGPDSS